MKTRSLLSMLSIFLWFPCVSFAQTSELDLGDDESNASTDTTSGTKENSTDSVSDSLAEDVESQKSNSPPLTGPQKPTEEVQVEQGDDSKSIDVDFFKPEYGDTEKMGRRPIVISGKTDPGVRVTVKSASIPRFSSKSGNVEVFKLTKKNTALLPARANSEGLFIFKLYVPEGQYQLPLLFKSGKGQSKRQRVMQISFKIEPKAVRLSGNESARGMRASPFLTKKNHVSLGLGANILVYQKKNTSDLAMMDVGFSSVKAPAVFLEYWRKFNEKFEFAVNYKYSPGETSSATNQSITVSKGVYAWTTIAADGIYYPRWLAIKKEKSYNIRGGIRFGFQYHSTPFLRRTESATDFEMVNNEVTMAALGYQFEYEPDPEWRYEAFMRYQHPLSTGKKYSVQAQFAFDGSLGFQRNFSGHKWSVGAFWYGQWHNYRTTEFDRGIQAQTTSSQMLFFSNVEGRLIYHY